MKVTEVIIPKEIQLLIVFSVALNILRVELFGSYSLIYLLWNIFLAFLPFLIASTLESPSWKSVAHRACARGSLLATTLS
jgi:uncharacterized membrane protein